jgi:hypothetical protein
MAVTRRKFDEDFRQGAKRRARRDIRRARIGRSEIGGVAAKRAANERDHHRIQCPAGDVSMLSETVHGRLLMTRNARPLARQQG